MSADGDTVREALRLIASDAMASRFVHAAEPALAALARLEAAAEAGQIGQHVCETDEGTWRPCPAGLCEGARLLTEHDHHYVKQVQRAMTAEAQRDTLAEALRGLLDAQPAFTLVTNMIAATQVARAALVEAGPE